MKTFKKRFALFGAINVIFLCFSIMAFFIVRQLYGSSLEHLLQMHVLWIVCFSRIGWDWLGALKNFCSYSGTNDMESSFSYFTVLRSFDVQFVSFLRVNLSSLSLIIKVHLKLRRK